MVYLSVSIQCLVFKRKQAQQIQEKATKCEAFTSKIIVALRNLSEEIYLGSNLTEDKSLLLCTKVLTKIDRKSDRQVAIVWFGVHLSRICDLTCLIDLEEHHNRVQAEYFYLLQNSDLEDAMKIHFSFLIECQTKQNLSIIDYLVLPIETMGYLK